MVLIAVLFGNALDPLSSVSTFIFFKQVRGLQSPRTESGGGRERKAHLYRRMLTHERKRVVTPLPHTVIMDVDRDPQWMLKSVCGGHRISI